MVGVRDIKALDIPEDYSLSQSYPNPFNPITEIRFQLPKDMNVEVNIYNSLGQKIRTLVNQNCNAGYHSFFWDAKDDYGNLVLSGIYFYKMHAGRFNETKKMTVLR